jgi:hypothetical protein
MEDGNKRLISPSQRATRGAEAFNPPDVFFRREVFFGSRGGLS